MLYDIALTIDYDYGAPSDHSRTLMRLLPVDLPGEQRVLSQRLVITPAPDERRDGQDFFGNATTAAVWHRPIDAVRLSLVLRVERQMLPQAPLAGQSLADLPGVLRGWRDLAPQSPHHFTAPSPRVPDVPAITAYAVQAVAGAQTVLQAIAWLGQALHRDMQFDADATSVETGPDQAFAQRSGVCQDFAHVMIAGLRGLGIPAGYVSGFLRTDPPPGQPRLEGADAMHAWVRAWAGPQTGWVTFDPTNNQVAGLDYVIVAQGRDYGDVAPVLGAMRSAGEQDSKQAVDVIPVLA